ncbi:photosynthetic complex putative assembly protein PuhB [Primorskyibacter sp. S187A]|uniref:photosynthetic complex putative assembly protein PuhB n=1 Tax=Primorskyibacter sp. S187A TaxID=3415130 RepID=UPI003C7A3498
MPHDITIEPVEGLPELPPEGEKILWQGKPNWWALAKESLCLYWVMGYFVFLAMWRFIVLSDRVPLVQAFTASLPFIILGLVACGLLALIAWVQSVTTMYTITNRRVAMRIGAALTVTLNLPYTRIANADLDLRRSGTGTITMELLEDKVQLSYLMTWPHVRPWKFRTQPALRCIPNAERVAAILADAADTQVSMPVIERAASPVAAE